MTKAGSTRILLMTEQLLLREAMCSRLQAEKDLNVTALASSPQEVDAHLSRQRSYTLVLDLETDPLGLLHWIRLWKLKIPSLRIILITDGKNRMLLQKIPPLGVAALIGKNDAIAELIAAIRRPPSPSIVLSSSLRSPNILSPLSGASPLSPRENEVLGCIAEGYSTRETARLLGISFKTVERHRENIKVKLGAKNASSLLREALRFFPKNLVLQD